MHFLSVTFSSTPPHSNVGGNTCVRERGRGRERESLIKGAKANQQQLTGEVAIKAGSSSAEQLKHLRMSCTDSVTMLALTSLATLAMAGDREEQY